MCLFSIIVEMNTNRILRLSFLSQLQYHKTWQVQRVEMSKPTFEKNSFCRVYSTQIELQLAKLNKKPSSKQTNKHIMDKPQQWTRANSTAVFKFIYSIFYHFNLLFAKRKCLPKTDEGRRERERSNGNFLINEK